MASDHEAGPAEDVGRPIASEPPDWSPESIERRLSLDQPACLPSSHAASSDLPHLAGFVEGLGLTLKEVRAVVADLKARKAAEAGRSLEMNLRYILARLGGLRAAKELLSLARRGRGLAAAP